MAWELQPLAEPTKQPNNSHYRFNNNPLFRPKGVGLRGFDRKKKPTQVLLLIKI